MDYCTDFYGNKVPDNYVRELILGDNKEVAHLTVCRFITKRELQPLHRKIIHHQANSKFTLDLAPRGHGKSTVGDVDYCITRILRDQNIRILIASKTGGQAQAFLKEIRAHFETNEDLIRIFGDLKSKKWNDSEFLVSTRTEIKKESTVTALGSSGAVVSKHFDLIIGDDLVGFENARTESQRTKLKEWFYSSCSPTLEPHGEMHILGTRYSPMDLYQDFINSGNYTIQVQQAINKFDETKRTHIAWRDKYNLIPSELTHGDEFSLWESKFDLDTLQKIRTESGSIIFGMQYQNDTELAKGNIFKPHYFRYYDSHFIKDGECFVRVADNVGTLEIKKVDVYFGVDLAISQSESADFFVIYVVGIDSDKNVYGLEYVEERLSFSKQMERITKLAELKYPMVSRIGIESNAYQLAMAQEMRRNSLLPIVDVRTVKDKITRAMRRSALFEHGKVFIKKDMQRFEEVLLLFPEVEHDDLFDGFDIALTVADKGKKVRVLDRSNFSI